MMKNIRVASVQFEHAAGDKKANLAKIERFVKQAAKQGVELIAFPECCVTGYLFLRKLTREQLLALAEPAFDGPSSLTLMALARKYHMTVGAGLVEIAGDGKMYNTYVVAMPNGEFQRHRKIHCFISEHLSCGSEFTVFDTPGGCRVAVLICYDNNIGENVRISALKGAEILLAPHQTGGCLTPSPLCMGVIERSLWDNRKANPQAIEAELKGPKGRQWLLTWLPARAHDNGLFLIFSNGVGVDGNEVRTGNAMILDPYGRILNETWTADDDMVIADLDPALRNNCTGVRWIKTRRPELYKPLTIHTGLEEDIRRVRWSHEARVAQT
ncbi:MAG: acyltransferase [Planctomycetes bacterium RBG_16_55_9]|nr:MAG: acyltransferase [Planctomycetes bacterium RBG_16_55_9]